MNSNLDNLISIFDKMNLDGFDTNNSLKWGFFFVDKSKEKLENVFNELRDNNYVLEDIYKTEDNDEDWILHASKVDTLTPDKLHKRNLAFNNLAVHCDVDLYDGWDVEKTNV